MDIYHELRQRGLTQSLRDFSKRWLSRGPNYACSNTDGYSLDTLYAFHNNLKDAGLDDLARGVIDIVFGDDAELSREAAK
jgi:hypothetical protein